MVGSVNAAPVGNTFDAYKQLAMASNIISPVIPAVAGGWVIKKSASYQYGYNNSTPGYNAGTPGYNTSTPASYNSGYSQADVAGASTTAQKVKTIAKGALIAIVVGAVSLLLLSVLLVYCCCCRRRNSRAAPERGDGGFMGYGASSYRPINSPAPGVSVGKNADYEPLVAPGEKIHAPNDDYHPSVAYDPPQPTSLGQYSTAWDQHKWVRDIKQALIWVSYYLMDYIFLFFIPRLFYHYFNENFTHTSATDSYLLYTRTGYPLLLF
jgi:hypothetical protein